MSTKPWYTSNDIIESIKRKISLPSSQSLFTDDDILKFVNEELLISQVPSVMLYHEEFFVTTSTTPLIDNQDHYEIPNRAIGLKLRSIFYQDQNNNLFELTLIDPQNKAFFTRSNNNPTNIYKYYLEGSDVVLVPNPGQGVSGSLLFNYFQRPNLLVTNDKAAIISSFKKKITLNSIAASNTLTITPTHFPLRAITSISTGTTITITSANHGLVNGDSVIVSNTNCSPVIIGTYSVSNCTATTFDIVPGNTITVGGTTGIIQKTNNGFTLTALGAVGTNPFTSAATLASTINNIAQGNRKNTFIAPTLSVTNISANEPTVLTVINHGYNEDDLVVISGSNSTPSIDGIYSIHNVAQNSFSIDAVVTVSGSTGSVKNIMNNFTLYAIVNGSDVDVYYPYVNTVFQTNNGANLEIQDNLTVVFNNVPLNIKPGSVVDFLQTNPGHKILGLSVDVPNGGVDFNANTVQFSTNDVPTNLLVGDYICEEHTCIIPYIPPDLHNGLAERTCARILAAIGDTNGLQLSLSKIQDINQAQSTLINNRVEGNSQKILNRTSPLRLGRFTNIRRP
jgi:hypothetical protein